MNFCKDCGGTTLTSSECAARERTLEETRGQLGRKVVAQTLDEEGKRLFSSATTAYATYVDAMGRYAYEVYVEGSIRNMVALAQERELHAKRTHDLAKFTGFLAGDTSTEDLTRVQRQVAAALAAVSTGTSAEREFLGKTQEAWGKYRDAEVALYQHVFGAKQGTERVRAALLLYLETRRAKECGPPSLQGD